MVAGFEETETLEAADKLSHEYGVKVVAFIGDLSIRENAESLIAKAVTELGRVDILINNAGGGVILPTLDHSEETVKRTIHNNLFTTLWCILAVIPHMVEQGYGRVVNAGAESVRNGLDDHAVYNAAKGGVHAAMTGFAREFANSGVTFNSVAPSFTLTPEAAKVFEDERLSPRLHTVVQRSVELIPMERPATVEEVASAFVFLASEEASFITGQVLSVNGGSSMG